MYACGDDLGVDNSLAVGGAWLLSLRHGKDRNSEKVTAHGQAATDAARASSTG
jgi:hypothetical protein